MTPDPTPIRLSEAQKRAVLWIGSSDKPIRPHRGTFSALAAFNLIRIGVTKLTAAIPPGEREYRDHYSLTPLGESVREHLLRKDTEGVYGLAP